MSEIDLDQALAVGAMLLAIILMFYLAIGFFTGRNLKTGAETEWLDDLAATMMPITQSIGGLGIFAALVAVFAKTLFVLPGTAEPDFWTGFGKTVGILAILFISPMVAYGAGLITGSLVTKVPATKEQ
ncbi:hypothetical protein [Marinobacterium sp. BA1]|uniref:hypothetical protein n=1 Tax=Marinobacterium sp. BA1 TaxID=3138931 RepID=UPI0032E59212